MSQVTRPVNDDDSDDGQKSPTMQLTQWQYQWFKENDPKKRKNPQFYAREKISEWIADANTEEMEKTNEVKISEEVSRFKRLLDQSGWRLVAPPRWPPVIAKSIGPCKITELLFEDEGNYNPPSVCGQLVQFARFANENNWEGWVPVLPKYTDILREIHDRFNSK